MRHADKALLRVFGVSEPEHVGNAPRSVDGTSRTIGAGGRTRSRSLLRCGLMPLASSPATRPGARRMAAEGEEGNWTMTRCAPRPSVCAEPPPRSSDVAVSRVPSETERSRIPRSSSPAEVTWLAAVLTTSWCCSVGSTWALLLDEHDLSIRPGPKLWISSGVPIAEPTPGSLGRKLLAQHGYRLFWDPDNSQRIRSVRRLGFVSRDAELILLAEAIRDQTIEHPEHPLVLAARWIATGFSAMAATDWVRAGILSPDAVHRPAIAQITVTTPSHSSARRPTPVHAAYLGAYRERHLNDVTSVTAGSPLPAD